MISDHDFNITNKGYLTGSEFKEKTKSERGDKNSKKKSMKAKNLNNDESIRFIIQKITGDENETGDSESPAM